MKKHLELVIYPSWNQRASNDLQAIVKGTTSFSETDILASLTGICQSRHADIIELKHHEPDSLLPDVSRIPNVGRGIVIPSYYLHQSCEIRPRDVVNTSEWFNWSIPYQPSHMFCLIDAEHWKILWVVRFSRFKAIKMYYLDPLATKPYKTRFNNLFSTSHMKKYKDNAQEFISLATDHPWPQLSSTPISCIPIHLTQDTKNSGPIAAFNISRVMEHYDPNGVNLLYVKNQEEQAQARKFLANILSSSASEFNSSKADEPLYDSLDPEPTESSDVVDCPSVGETGEDLRQYLDSEFREIFPQLFHIHSAAKLLQDAVIATLEEDDLRDELLQMNFLDFVADGDRLTPDEKENLMHHQQVTFPQPIFTHYDAIIKGKARNQKLCNLYSSILHECVDILVFEKNIELGPATQKAIAESKCDDLARYLHTLVDRVRQIQKLSYRVQNLMMQRYFKRYKFTHYDENTGYPMTITSSNQTYTLIPPLDVLRVIDDILSNWGTNPGRDRPYRYRIVGGYFKKLVYGRVRKVNPSQPIEKSPKLTDSNPPNSLITTLPDPASITLPRELTNGKSLPSISN